MKFNRSFLSVFTILLGLAALPANAQVRRLTQDEALRAATAKPQPEYPPVAKQLRITGSVEVEVSIDPTGTVDGVKVLSGNAALTGTLMATLKKWHFQPFLEDGKPARAVAVLSFTFKL